MLERTRAVLGRRANTRIWVLAIASVLLAILAWAGGYALRSPGSVRTWDEIRSWLTFVVIALGFGVTIIELRQRGREFNEQSEVLGIQRRQMVAADVADERKQADGVTFRPERVFIEQNAGQIVQTPTDRIELQINNGSPRPISQIAVFYLSADAGAPDSLEACRIDRSDLPRNAILLPGASMIVGPKTTWPNSLVVVRFTDDVGVAWVLTEDMHLERWREDGPIPQPDPYTMSVQAGLQ